MLSCIQLAFSYATHASINIVTLYSKKLSSIIQIQLHFLLWFSLLSQAFFHIQQWWKSNKAKNTFTKLFMTQCAANRKMHESPTTYKIWNTGTNMFRDIILKDKVYISVACTQILQSI
jgi:hypothetical protein